MTSRRAAAGVTALVLFAVVTSVAHATGPMGLLPDDETFEYSGDRGPAYWANLRPGNAACSESLRQSPIDITKPVPDRTLGPLDVMLLPAKIDLLNIHRTIEAVYTNGSTLRFGGETYELVQFHFHTLSEHTVSGQRGVMELHVVFASIADGDLAVIGQLYRIGPADPFLAEFADHLPQMDGDRYAPGETFDVAYGLRNTKRYYTYPGSLTTPPCDPIVTWIVLKEWATMSQDQFRKFRDVLGNDFRPIQATNGRTIRATVGRSEGIRSPGSPRLPVRR